LKLIDAIEDNLQDHFIYDVIVVDDSSPDGTGEIVENYAIGKYNDYHIKSVAEMKPPTITIVSET